MTEKEYRAHPAVNFSSLVWLDKNPRLYYRNKFNPTSDVDKAYFAVGGGLDVIITGGMEEFKKTYYILKNKRSTGKLGTFIEKYVFLMSTGIEENIAFDQAYTESGYAISKERVLKEIDKDPYCKEKLEYLKKGYRILDCDEGKLVMNMAETLMKWERSRKWFEKKPGVEIKMQFPIIFPAGERECKALLDLLYIDHNNKRISPIDLKTTGEVIEEFRSKFVANRYYLQAAMYTDAVHHWVLLEKMLGRDYSDYIIENFRFLTVEKEIDSVPLVYQCNDDDLKCGKYGGTIYDRYRKGYLELLNDLSWHEKNRSWNAPRDVYEADNEIVLGVFRNDSKSTESAEEPTTLPF